MDEALYEAMADEQSWHWWYVGRRAMIAQSLDAMALPVSARLCDVGCGPGGNLALLARYGSVIAIESQARARAYAQALNIAAIVEGSLPNAIDWEALWKRQGGAFDVVAALDVLEHVEDDQAALHCLAQGLKPKGRLLISVPAHPWLWSAHDTAHRHFRRYRREELIQKAQACGFHIARLGYFNSFLFFPIAAVRLLLKQSSNQSAAPNHRRLERLSHAGPLNRLLCHIFKSETIFVNHLRLRHYFPWGVSLMAVLEKR